MHKRSKSVVGGYMMKDEKGGRGWWTDGKSMKQLLVGMRSEVEGQKN